MSGRCRKLQRNPKTVTKKKWLEGEIGRKDDERRQPREKADNAEREDIGVPWKHAGFEGQEVNGHRHWIADHEKNIRELREHPLPQRPLENEKRENTARSAV